MLLEEIKAIVGAARFTNDPASQPGSLAKTLAESKIVNQRNVEIFHVIR